MILWTGDFILGENGVMNAVMTLALQGTEREGGFSMGNMMGGNGVMNAVMTLALREREGGFDGCY